MITTKSLIIEEICEHDAHHGQPPAHFPERTDAAKSDGGSRKTSQVSMYIVNIGVRALPRGGAGPRRCRQWLLGRWSLRVEARGRTRSHSPHGLHAEGSLCGRLGLTLPRPVCSGSPRPFRPLGAGSRPTRRYPPSSLFVHTTRSCSRTGKRTPWQSGHAPPWLSG